MNSGMKPMAMNSACASGGGTAQGSATPAWRVASASAHHRALVASMSAALKKPSRCGAVSSRPRRQRVSTGGVVGPAPLAGCAGGRGRAGSFGSGFTVSWVLW